MTCRPGSSRRAGTDAFADRSRCGFLMELTAPESVIDLNHKDVEFLRLALDDRAGASRCDRGVQAADLRGRAEGIRVDVTDGAGRLCRHCQNPPPNMSPIFSMIATSRTTPGDQNCRPSRRNWNRIGSRREPGAIGRVAPVFAPQPRDKRQDQRDNAERRADEGEVDPPLDRFFGQYGIRLSAEARPGGAADLAPRFSPIWLAAEGCGCNDEGHECARRP